MAANHLAMSPRASRVRCGSLPASIPGERIVVVAHGGALSMALADLLDGNYHEWTRVMDNCAVSELVLEPSPKLVSFNHTDHLQGV